MYHDQACPMCGDMREAHSTMYCSRRCTFLSAYPVCKCSDHEIGTILYKIFVRLPGTYVPSEFTDYCRVLHYTTTGRGQTMLLKVNTYNVILRYVYIYINLSHNFFGIGIEPSLRTNCVPTLLSVSAEAIDLIGIHLSGVTRHLVQNPIFGRLDDYSCTD